MYRLASRREIALQLAKAYEQHDFIVRWPDMTDGVVRRWAKELKRLVPTN
jgi:hypothetical protein